jgi:hypothetical protein
MNFGDIAKAITSQQVLDKTRERNPEAAKGVDLAARATKTEVVYFTISHVTIPAKRATVTAKATADFGDIAQKKFSKHLPMRLPMSNCAIRFCRHAQSRSRTQRTRRCNSTSKARTIRSMSAIN